MELKVREEEQKTFIELPEKLDISTIPFYKEDILNIINGCENDIVLDMKETKFIDSTAIGNIIMFMKLLTKKNRKLYITNPEENVKDSFETARIFNFIELI
ncbi:MAG: STAS domain-containing protein [Spirochaetota bacterium]